MRSVVAVLLVAVFASVQSAKLPTYIKACKRTEPKLNECVVKNGREAIPQLVNGDQKLGIPKLDPLDIEKVVVGDSKSGRGLGITFTCNKCKIAGLKNAILNDAKVDLKKQYLEFFITIPTVKVTGKYTATGKVLVLPISGNGDTEITVGNLKLVYRTSYELKKGKDNKDHIKLKNPKLEFKAEDFKIMLTNLFNGDKTLGNQMNVFLNENWREVLDEFGPAIAETVDQIINLIVNKIADKVSYDDIFPK